MKMIHVTQCGAAYQELTGDRSIDIDSGTIVNIVPVDPELGIGKSIIFFRDGSSMNVLESPEELFLRRFDSF